MCGVKADHAAVAAAHRLAQAEQTDIVGRRVVIGVVVVKADLDVGLVRPHPRSGKRLPPGVENIVNQACRRASAQPGARSCSTRSNKSPSPRPRPSRQRAAGRRSRNARRDRECRRTRAICSRQAGIAKSSGRSTIVGSGYARISSTARRISSMARGGELDPVILGPDIIADPGARSFDGGHVDHLVLPRMPVEATLS